VRAWRGGRQRPTRRPLPQHPPLPPLAPAVLLVPALVTPRLAAVVVPAGLRVDREAPPVACPSRRRRRRWAFPGLSVRAAVFGPGRHSASPLWVSCIAVCAFCLRAMCAWVRCLRSVL
jgi:hypothetical protein